MVSHQDFSIGDRVTFVFGTKRKQGVVVNDRGHIGANRRRILVVRVPNDPYDEELFEIPEDEIAILESENESIANSEIVDYLANGGLLQILNANLSGGKNQPRVWIRRDNIGNVVHTFDPERGMVGGETVPFFALHNNRVFAPIKDKMVNYLRSFGISKEEAEFVISEVGTAP